MYLLPSPSFRRRPACMDAGGRAMSGTKAEESSGLWNTFPPGGHDHAWVIPASAICLTLRPVFLGPFQTRLYYGSAELAERSASMQAWIPACVGMTTGRKQRLKDPESIAGLYLIFNDWHRSRYLAQTARAGLPGACSGRQ